MLGAKKNDVLADVKRPVSWRQAATGAGPAGCKLTGPTAYPVYGSPYYPDLSVPQDDPQFWQLWVGGQGGG